MLMMVWRKGEGTRESKMEKIIILTNSLKSASMVEGIPRE
jgi:hypothetical protein